MGINESKLRKIINEEARRVLSEQSISRHVEDEGPPQVHIRSDLLTIVDWSDELDGNDKEIQDALNRQDADRIQDLLDGDTEIYIDGKRVTLDDLLERL
jgi:hypothetical protein